MGIFFNTVNSLPELKRNNIIEKLLAMDIKETKDGTSIYELDYKTLKRELTITSFREVNVENGDNKWF